MGMFICFILPGILVGLLLGLGSRTAQQHLKKAKGTGRHAKPPVYAKHQSGRLFIYNMREDQMERDVA